RGLKVWMGLRRHGTRELGRWIDANVSQARHLWQRALEHPDFEPATAPAMSAVCLRYAQERMDEPHSARLHARVARGVEEGGRFWISPTVLKGRTWFRVNPVNFRTRTEHVDELFDLLCRECGEAGPSA